MGPSKAAVERKGQGPELRKQRNQSSGTTMLRQTLLWPPPPSTKTPKGSGDSDRATAVKNGSSAAQVDLIQATRMTSKPVPLPVSCGLGYLDTGVRFDPGEFPDLSRKTQEKLAGKIIEAGTTREYGRTIKVKEYSSKTRKRIRFSCSRDDCSVTFQINFDSTKGVWYMKRNKGNFDHSCSALRNANKEQASTMFCAETNTTRPRTPPVVPVVSPPLSKPRTTGSSKTGTAPPALPSSLTSPSRAPPLRRLSSMKRSNEDSDSSTSPHRSTPKKIRTTRTAPSASSQNAKISEANLVTPQTKQASRSKASKSITGASKPKKKSLSMAREPRPSSAASADFKQENNKSTRATRAKPSQEGQSTQSSVTPPSPPRKLVCAADLPQDMFSTPLAMDEHGGLDDFPPLPTESYEGAGMHLDEVDETEPLHAFDRHFHEGGTNPQEPLMYQYPTMESYGHGHVYHPPYFSHHLPPPPPPPSNGHYYHPRYHVPRTPDGEIDEEGVGRTSPVGERGPPKLENLSQQFSHCSLLVPPPHEFTRVGSWERDAHEGHFFAHPPPPLPPPEMDYKVSPYRYHPHGDDNSSISSNWSFLESELKTTEMSTLHDAEP